MQAFRNTSKRKVKKSLIAFLPLKNKKTMSKCNGSQMQSYAK
jgi:hypothetical protein